jgi:prepilin-type N-terminal cleavage/methylation domain-containing protein
MTLRQPQSGFTLIEILVVIVLVTLIMGIGVIGVRGSDRRVLSMAAEDLAQTVAKAAIVSRSTSAPVSLMFEPEDAVNPASYYLTSFATNQSLGWFNPVQGQPANLEASELGLSVADSQTTLVKGVQLSIEPLNQQSSLDNPALVTEVDPLLTWGASGITQPALVTLSLGESSLRFKLSSNSRLSVSES